MIRSKILIILLFIIYINAKGQNISVGLNAEPFCLISTIGSSTESKLYSTSFYIKAGYRISSRVKVEVSPGIIFSERKRYNAFPEVGLFGKYFLRADREYLLFGLVAHSNKAESSNSIHMEGNTIYLGSIGVGTYVERNLLLEIQYQFPLGEKQFNLQDQVDLYNNHLFTPMKLIGLIKLGFGVSFDL